MLSDIVISYALTNILFGTDWFNFATQIWNFLQQLTQSEMTINKIWIGLIVIYLLLGPIYRIN